VTAAIRLQAGRLDATLEARDVLAFTSLRHDGSELLVAPDELPAAYRVHGEWAGIAFMHPWANRLAADDFEVAGAEVRLAPEDPAITRDGNGLAIHGLRAPAGAWRLRQLGRSTAEAVMTHDGAPGSPFPFPHEVRVDVALREGRLSVRTAVEPTADRPVPLAFGWHPYLRPPGTARTSWRLEMPARRHLELDDRGIPTGAATAEAEEDDPIGDRRFDDAYDELAPGPCVAVTGGGLRIAVLLEAGYPVAQVFAPPDAAVVALEPMTAPPDALVSGRGLRVVAPGDIFPAVFGVAVDAAVSA
jgi:aldose 1-epimerase